MAMMMMMVGLFYDSFLCESVVIEYSNSWIMSKKSEREVYDYALTYKTTTIK